MTQGVRKSVCNSPPTAFLFIFKFPIILQISVYYFKDLRAIICVLLIFISPSMENYNGYVFVQT